jgi:superfamily I DNA/RNA helicase/mRNA-degrading endonuclease RelE of RelBE toxin-antitoxin system
VTFDLIHKPTFEHQLLALPPEYMPQVLAKVATLRQDPAPYHNVKKKLHGYKGNIYRLRSGDFRIIYTYGDGWVALLGVDRRADVYKGGKVIAADDDLAFDLGAVPDADAAMQREPARVAVSVMTQPAPASATLPMAIDRALLERLRIPEQHMAALLKCKTEDDLLNADVPQEICTRVVDVIFPRDYEQVAEQQPDLVTGDVDNLLRYKEGSLLGFLLRLSPAQERYVTWGLSATGPTLLKGGPGTGKSTVALYRTREFVRTLRRAGNPFPRILFTTYTNALVTYSQQLLRELLGEDAACVEVQTADKLAMSVVGKSGGSAKSVKMAEKPHMREAISWAIDHAAYAGNALQQQAQRLTIERLGPDYVLEEINAVIEARQIDTIEDYLVAARSGRRVPLNATQRVAVWTVHEQLQERLASMGVMTWQQLRAAAELLVAQGKGPEPYDAVLIDEAQDLDPSLLRMLVNLCSGPNRLFLAADANQTIYGSGFTWTDVHERLSFRGRTGMLRVNFRTTREIGEATRAYLAGGALDEVDSGGEYVHEGPMPDVRVVERGYDECELLARFLPQASRHFQFSRSACAVLVPSDVAGKQIAAELTQRGLPARYMASKELDLSAREIKVLTLQSAKGLEFPIVALAGFVHGPYPWRPATMPDDAFEETLSKERRVLYVAMTRAMRALLVAAPQQRSSSLFDGFDPAYWNLG